MVAPPSSGQTRIIGNLIENNSASSSNGGGGISLFAAGSPIVENNIIEGNNGGDAGGGLAMWNDSSPVIVQNLFFQNTSSQGGAVYWVIPVSSLKMGGKPCRSVPMRARAISQSPCVTAQSPRPARCSAGAD